MSIYSVMNVSLMNYDTQRKVKCINDNVFLAHFDLLVAINATVASTVVGGFDASGINYSYIGSIFLTHQAANDNMQSVNQLLKYALQLPFVEVVEDCVEVRKVPREHTPLAPR